MPNGTGTIDLMYDVENRLARNGAGPGGELSYGPDNRRIYDGTATQSVNFKAVVNDQLGSVRVRDTQRFSYFPCGEEMGTETANGVEKFGTYRREDFGNNQIDYADQRYYGSIHGRFLTPDPYEASGGPEEPQSWNKYAYVEGDPVNYNDPTGLRKAAEYYDSPTVFRVDVYAAAPRPLSPVEVEILLAQTSRRPEVRVGHQPVLSNSERAEQAYDLIRGDTHRAAGLQSIFTNDQLDCIVGIETGRTWDPNIVAQDGRIGMFQFNQNSWAYSGTDIAWSGGASAKDPYTCGCRRSGLVDQESRLQRSHQHHRGRSNKGRPAMRIFAPIIFTSATAMTLATAFGAQVSDTKAIRREVVVLLATDFKLGAKNSEAPRVEVRQCPREDGAKIQIVAWQSGRSAPSLTIDTTDFGVVQSFARANVFVVETGGATRDQVYVIEYRRGVPKLVVKRVTKGTAEIKASRDSVDVIIAGIYAGDASPRSELHHFVLDLDGTKPQ